MAEHLGFNQEVPFEGRVPVGKLEVAEEPLELARTAAGFRGSTLSPLGAAHLAYVVANGGRAVRIHIIDSVGDYQAPSRRQSLRRLLSPWAAGQLRKMMEVTVHTGTSRKAFTNEEGKDYLPGIRVAGKTGTLQAGRRTPTTSWFTGFAPSRRPQLVVSVLLENGSVWRQKANEVARDLLRTYFAGKGVRGVTPPL
jgi:cell division protein FtsI/penicillin-binding protein 2